MTGDDVQLIYISQPFGYDMQRLNSILSIARSRNARDGVTGALICRHDMFLQLLEGPREKVEATFARIRIDDRHVDLRRLWCEPMKRRIFPQWEMLHDPARSWMWTPQEVLDGAPALAPRNEVFSIFARIATEPLSNGIPVL